MSKLNFVFVFFLIAAVSMTTGNVAHASTCKSAAEREAFYVQSVLTDLSEAGFSCMKPEEYADFKKRFGASLKRYNDMLAKRFRTTYGATGSRKFTTYLTDLANRASLRSAIKRASFCTRSHALYSGTRDMDPAKLGEYAIKTANTETDVPKSCRK